MSVVIAAYREHIQCKFLTTVMHSYCKELVRCCQCNLWLGTNFLRVVNCTHTHTPLCRDLSWGDGSGAPSQNSLCSCSAVQIYQLPRGFVRKSACFLTYRAFFISILFSSFSCITKWCLISMCFLCRIFTQVLPWPFPRRQYFCGISSLELAVHRVPKAPFISKYSFTCLRYSHVLCLWRC